MTFSEYESAKDKLEEAIYDATNKIHCHNLMHELRDLDEVWRRQQRVKQHLEGPKNETKNTASDSSTTNEQ